MILSRKPAPANLPAVRGPGLPAVPAPADLPAVGSRPGISLARRVRGLLSHRSEPTSGNKGTMFWCPVSERWVIPYQGMSDQESAAIWGISVPEFLKMRADNEAFRQAYWAERGGEPTTEELDAFYAALPEDPTDYGAHGRQPAEQSRNRPSGKVRPNNQHARHGPAGEIGQG